MTPQVDLPLHLLLQIFRLVNRLALIGLFFDFLDSLEYFPCLQSYFIQLIVDLLSCRLTRIVSGVVFATVPHKSETAVQSTICSVRKLLLLGRGLQLLRMVHPLT